MTIFKYLLVMLFMTVAAATVSFAQRRITVEIEGKPTKVELVVNDNRSENFKAKEPNRATVAFEAIVDGDTKGSSRISIHRNVVTGFIYQNGVAYAVSGKVGQAIKASKFSDLAMEKTIREVKAKISRNPNKSFYGDGLATDPVIPANMQPTILMQSPQPKRTMEVFYGMDNEWIATFGTVYNASLEAEVRLNNMEAFFVQEFNINVSIKGYETPIAGQLDWSSVYYPGQIDDIDSWHDNWTAFFATYPHLDTDIEPLFTGEQTGIEEGISWNNGACTTQSQSASGLETYSPVGSIVTHESMHLLGHSAPPHYSYTLNLMHPSVISFDLLPESKLQVDNFLNQGGAGCMGRIRAF